MGLLETCNVSVFVYLTLRDRSNSFITVSVVLISYVAADLSGLREADNDERIVVSRKVWMTMKMPFGVEPITEVSGDTNLCPVCHPAVNISIVNI